MRIIRVSNRGAFHLFSGKRGNEITKGISQLENPSSEARFQAIMLTSNESIEPNPKVNLTDFAIFAAPEERLIPKRGAIMKGWIRFRSRRPPGRPATRGK